ncbi:MAG: hypothetical protein V3V33_13520 [Candidatus Lokiarchaeia archaeon]
MLKSIFFYHTPSSSLLSEKRLSEINGHIDIYGKKFSEFSPLYMTNNTPG